VKMQFHFGESGDEGVVSGGDRHFLARG
jgi:hypothetical protein